MALFQMHLSWGLMLLLASSCISSEATNCDKLLQDLLSNTSKVQAVMPIGSQLHLVVADQVYQVPFSTDTVNASSFDASQITHLGVWTQMKLFEQAMSAIKEPNAKLVEANVLHSNKIGYSLSVVYRKEGTNQLQHCMTYEKSTRGPPDCVSQIIGNYGVVTDNTGKHSYAFWAFDYKDSNNEHVTILRQVVNATDDPPQYMIPLENKTSLTIGTKWLEPFDVRTTANTLTIYSRESGNKVQENLPQHNVHTIRLPVFGFIFDGFVHLWVPDTQKVFVFPDPWDARIFVAKETMKSVINMTVFEFDKYFKCAAPSKLLKGAAVLALGIGLAIVALLIILVVLITARRRNREGKPISSVKKGLKKKGANSTSSSKQTSSAKGMASSSTSIARSTIKPLPTTRSNLR